MKFLKEFWNSIKVRFLAQSPQRKSMAKIILDDLDGKSFEFDIEDLIYIDFDKKSELIVVCVKGREPKFLPLTGGNIGFLQTIIPYQSISLERNLKAAQNKFAESLSTDTALKL